MFKKNMHTDEKLQKAIDSVYADLDGTTAETEEYAAAVDQLVKLYSLKEQTAPKRVSPDTMATVAAHLAGIILIVGHERAHVVTSKALGFVQKLR